MSSCGRVLFVVSIVYEEGVYHLISARKAERHVRKRYEEESSKNVAAVNSLKPERPIRLGRGAEGLRLAAGLSRVMRGRPKGGAKAAGSKSRAVRLTDAEWEAVDELAAKTGLTSHGVMREAIVQWLARVGASASAASVKRAVKRKAG